MIFIDEILLVIFNHLNYHQAVIFSRVNNKTHKIFKNNGGIEKYIAKIEKIYKPIECSLYSKTVYSVFRDTDIKHGEYKEWFKDKVVANTLHYVNNLLHGDCISKNRIPHGRITLTQVKKDKYNRGVLILSETSLI